jgi:hypothetical protein
MRRRIPFLLLAACFLVPVLDLAAADLEGLKALMIDLPGWEANTVDGTDVSAGGIRALMVSRSYQNGDRMFEPTILFGTQAETAWLPAYKEGYKAETADGIIEVRRINGFLAYDLFEKESGSGGILVLLLEAKPGAGNGAVLAVSYDGMSREEAMKIAQRFNWTRMKEQVGRLK